VARRRSRLFWLASFIVRSTLLPAGVAAPHTRWNAADPRCWNTEHRSLNHAGGMHLVPLHVLLPPPATGPGLLGQARSGVAPRAAGRLRLLGSGALCSGQYNDREETDVHAIASPPFSRPGGLKAPATVCELNRSRPSTAHIAS
jgi:hypothetical protein